MKHENMTQKEQKFARIRKVQSLPEILERFFARHQGKGNLRILHLWINWDMVMGEELHTLAFPLGTGDGVLVIGADDSMVLSELSYYTDEILDRVNAFMDEPYFKKVRLELIGPRTPLNQQHQEQRPPKRPPARPRPENVGALMDRFDPDTPVGRAYRSYVRSFADPEHS